MKRDAFKGFLINLALGMSAVTAAVLVCSYAILNAFNMDTSPITSHLPELIIRGILLYLGIALFIALFLQLVFWLREKYFN